MGTKGVKQTRRETPKSLQAFADELEEVIATLRRTAEGMLLSGVHVVDVRYSPGAHAELRDTIRPFAEDARKKAEKAGAQLPPS